eukprot:TRINITY_DN54276_c0_g1_i1.p2 TRINITY_DN54276_c0_g1~~TRINITY_DN54276_c0_g1_i1.p2  ORF type:complete len:262 (-),score=42.42 TRINITY_DN54276_c0_g1_i1:74-859(-)
MSEVAADSKRGGFSSGVEGRGRGGARGPRRARGGRRDDKEWVPCTKLGRLVKDKKITKIDDIFLFSLPIKEAPIVDLLLGDNKLTDEVMKISPVQKASSAGQQTRFKAWVVVGDNNGHVGVGVRCSKEAAGAIRGAIVAAKLNIVPVRRGHWGSKFGEPHTVPCKVSGKCGSVMFRIVPAPRGTGLVASVTPKKVLTMAGIKDAYTASNGQTRTVGNYVFAVYEALKKTYTYLTPEFWTPTVFAPTPYEQFSAYLKDKKKQ